MSSFNDDGSIRIDNGNIIAAVGKKRSGKTGLALVILRSFPHDVIVIDPAGDDGPVGDGVVEWSGPVSELPRSFPEHERARPGERVILRYRPDAGSTTYLEDMDAVVGVALAHSTRERPALLVVHEMGVLAKSNRVPPHTRRVLQHSRHSGLICVFTMPRPITVDPQVIGQADLVYVFELPNASDRKRIAETIGWPLDSLDAAMEDMPVYWSLRFDANEAKPPPDETDMRLVMVPPLPADVVDDAIRWSRSVPAPARELV